MSGTEVLGWASSLVLMLTLAKQVVKQWRTRTVAGVSRWLFVGQVAASLGFTAYSWLVGNRVFVVTNFLILCAAITGVVIDRRNRRASA